MTSPFARAVHASSRALDAVAGERFQVVPMIAGQYSGAIPDPDRPAFEFVGTYKSDTDRIKLTGSPFGSDISRQVVSASLIVTVAEDVLAGRSIQTGDILHRLDIAGVPRFEVSTNESDGLGRRILTLIEIATP